MNIYIDLLQQAEVEKNLMKLLCVMRHCLLVQCQIEAAVLKY
jgi:hypothetical protein